MQIPVNSFTTKYHKTSRILHSETVVMPAFNPIKIKPEDAPEGKKYNAIWDTGATGSVITQKVVDDLNLKPISMMKVHGIGGETISPVHRNAPCPCGSGKRYRKCCRPKNTDEGKA